MQVIAENLFLLLMAIFLVGLVVVPIPWLLLSIFTPKTLLDRFFKEPHFTLTETYMMNEFPGSLMRTAMFGWTIFFPNIAKKRDIFNVVDYMPTWYFIALTLLIVFAMIIIFACFVLMPGLVLMTYLMEKNLI